jgi:hypothetical protein
MKLTRPSVLERCLSLACYLGLAPLTKLSRSCSSNSFVQHHRAQSMAAFFCLLLLFMAYIGIVYIALSVAIILFPDFLQQLIERFGWLGVYVNYAVYLPVLGLVAIWMTLLGLAAKGSMWQMPLLKQLSRKPRVIRFSFFANCLLWVLVPIVTFLAVYTTSLTQRSREGAAVYFLYDEGISVPRWSYALGLSRIALQAQKNWGKNCTVLDRLTKETLRVALANGKVVILATHGADGYAGTYFAPETLFVGPPPLEATDEVNNARFLQMSVIPYNWENLERLKNDKWDKWENVPVSSQLQLAYVFACNGGNKASQWQEHLAPARVITYNRASVIWDHVLWLAFTGPLQLKKLQ